MTRFAPILRIAGTAALAVAWAALAYIAIAGDPARGCRDMVYRDPVTGRDEARGGARLLADGRVACPRG
jgi:hypothetical protein